MPLYKFFCPKCQGHAEKLLPAKRRQEPQICPKPDCGGSLERDFGGAAQSTKIVEVIDNGAMSKRLERLADAERLFKERAAIPESKFRKF